MKTLTISETDNGYILTHKFGEDEDIYVVQSESGDNDIDKECVTKMLARVNDLMGIEYDAWSKENLNITWDEKGDETE